MLTLVSRRLLTFVPILLIVSFGVFLLTALIPGDAATTLAGGPNATPEAVAAVRERFHFDDPLLVQYLRWLGDLAQLDFGSSVYSGVPVTESLGRRAPVSFSLVAAAVVVALAIALPMGIGAGVRPGGWVDRAGRITSSLGIGIPNFWLAALLVLFFSLSLSWLPPSGFEHLGDSPGGWARSVTLPAIALGMYLSAEMTRQVRAALMTELDSNYVRSLWAKGARTPRVVSHAMRSAASPAITVLGVQVGILLGGTVIIEQIFAIPGVGTYLVDGVTSQDVPVIQGVTMLFVIIQMGMSLVVDIAYGVLNPKVRVAS